MCCNPLSPFWSKIRDARNAAEGNPSMSQGARPHLLRMADGFEVMATRVDGGIVGKGGLAECLRRRSNEPRNIATYDEDIPGGS